ncbi:MAG: hypothetical protein OXE84_06160, partial [Rhodobacteraceae bacterium]|nr:hypothetical protein [Paracoccaceae bacterium]
DVLLLFNDRESKPYWFRTGSPRFLFETLKAKSVSPRDLEGRLTDDESLMSTFEIDDIDVKALLFQTGYLTITDEQSDGFDTLYQLDYPNQEVRVSLNRGLLQSLGKTVAEARGQGRDLCARLEANDFEGFAETLKAYLASLPYHSGTPRGIWRAMRPGLPACCRCVSAPSGWMSAPRRRPAMGRRTWWCTRAGRYSCWNSR